VHFESFMIPCANGVAGNNHSAFALLYVTEVIMASIDCQVCPYCTVTNTITPASIFMIFRYYLWSLILAIDYGRHIFAS
jgi:hypothetical protein